MRRLILLIALAALTGCGPSREQMLDAAHNDCFAYGFDQGTPAYAQCMMSKDSQYQQMEMQRRANIQRSLAATQQAIAAQQPIQMAPRTCTSSTFGNQTTTNCQ